ncbi:MAG: tetraacyldisaccharide 4'-kinase [Pyrinomonadaceae bacterium]
MLSLLSAIYGKVADIRNTLYDKGIFESHDLGARVISVGNITTGGTGKTPLVAYIANILAASGEKVCILTRGYGRNNPKNRVLVSDGENIRATAIESGDEPFELAYKLLGKAIIIADADRVAAAEWAKRKFGVTVFLLDDGFQHRKASRDLDIVCIDATKPFGGRKMLPAGRLREPLAGLSRADVVVITRADLVEDISDLRCEISKWSPNATMFVASNKIVRMVELEEFHAKGHVTRKETAEMYAFAFCGLGNPKGFFERLIKEKIYLLGTRIFPDHHIYSQEEVDDLHRDAHRSSVAMLLTTAKDAVKLSNLKFEMPCFVVEIEMELDRPADFSAML